MSKSSKKMLIPLCILILLSSFLASHTALDTINVSQTIKDGDTIVSSGGNFEMGFFNLGTSKKRYMGVCYKNIDVITPVWIANRETPLADSLGTLKITKAGVLVLVNSTSHVIWSSNVSSSVQDPIVQLLDTGNLVIKNAGEKNPKNFLWQSFDYPGNTLLDGMKMGKNFVTGQEWQLTSWKSDDDPSPGDYIYKINTEGFPQITMLKDGNVSFRVGPWMGDRFSGQPKLKKNIVFQYQFMFGKEEVNYSIAVLNKSALPRRVLSPTGQMQWWTWAERAKSWGIYSSGPPTDSCDDYGLCGTYGSCNVDNNPLCVCLDKFVGKYPDDYDRGDWSNGCVRKISLNCKEGDKFLKYSGFKLPDTRKAFFNESMTLEECRLKCIRDCSCTAYSNINFEGNGSGCFIWTEDLMDLRSLVDGQDIFIRMASSESDLVSPAGSVGNKPRPGGNKRDKIVVALSITIPILLLCLGLALFLRKRKHENLVTTGEPKDASYPYSNEHRTHKDDLELPLFNLAEIITATDYFSLNNKLGEGGYGTVYKARFEGGQEVAVKRLSETSKQGFDEFMNEAMFIAKLQHRNLVKLLGCCIQADEKMLIYEYMSNKSLDFFIFDETRSSMLDWPMRFQIINGIARGILYLHQDSRLRIIHRDLKASNILLDIDMNPKIADFGMARCFGGNETAGNTKRVVGTYGYMSPEYQLDGLFSVKSDVFSFGVLVLEIICGRRNRGFHHPRHHFNLLGHVKRLPSQRVDWDCKHFHDCELKQFIMDLVDRVLWQAWTLFNEGQSLELVDAHAMDSCHLYEILRCIHVALLCVQQNTEDRPTMSNVVLMLGGEGALPQPKQPGFFTERNALEDDYGTTSSKGAQTSFTNEITITLLDAR